MDIVLQYADSRVLTPYVYPAWWAEDDPVRQTLSLLLVTNLGGVAIYLIFATLSYYLVFDHKLMSHPQFLENQVRKEIKYAVQSMPWISIPTVALFLLEVRGYSRLYDSLDNSAFGLLGVLFSMMSFLFFTDMVIYWIHRILHHKSIYKTLHKPHHKWKVPTPFASHAFHPIDGFMQSLPYHIYPFLFPLHKGVYLGLYIFVNIWTVSIHDGDYRVPQILRDVINGSAHHTDHHLYFECNYGQYFTLWDRLAGSYKHPSAFEKRGSTAKHPVLYCYVATPMLLAFTNTALSIMGKGPHDYLRKLQTDKLELSEGAVHNGHTVTAASPAGSKKKE